VAGEASEPKPKLAKHQSTKSTQKQMQPTDSMSADVKTATVRIHSSDFNTNIKVGIKNTSELATLFEKLQGARSAFKGCNQILESSSKKVIDNASSFKEGESYIFVNKDRLILFLFYLKPFHSPPPPRHNQ